MSQHGPLRLRDFLKKLKKFGIQQLTNTRGKGSEIILLLPVEKGSRKGPQYPIKNHGMGTEINRAVISSALSRFKINEDDFWNS